VIRVLIAEDKHMIRGALVALLQLEPDIEVVAELDRGDAIVDTALKSRPNVAVIDIDLPGLDGLSAAASLRERLPSCQTLVLTGLSQPGNLLRALKAHVKGFLSKDAPAAALANAIRAVAAGRRVFDPELVAVAVETGASPLTDRETAVLRAAVSGRSMSKLGARNRMDAVRIATEAGWL
jgi:two-component system, NarL family, response regulator DesR